MVQHGFALSALLLGIGAVHAAPVLSESFDDVTTLQARGWVLQNNSSPAGTQGWFQGTAMVFNAASGAPGAYIAANYNSTTAGGAISNWLLTPELQLGDGAVLTFAWRAPREIFFFDLLEVYVSASGAGADVGQTVGSVGSFVRLAAFSSENLPSSAWRTESITLSGMGDFSGRLGFRYLGTDFHANYLGLDDVVVMGAVPEPGSIALLGWGLLGLAVLRRGRR